MIRAIVTDIEGTTSSLSFVKEVLFPYARENMAAFIEKHRQDNQVQAILADADSVAGGGLNNDQLIAQLLRWIDEDKKITPLKALQGLIWEAGYRQGDFKGHIYRDAVDKLTAWKAKGVALYVYSSGSVFAQKLLFGHTEFGDLTTLFSGYFDTRIGAKKEQDSYRKIAEQLATAAADILFLSDIEEELNAAQAVGFQTILLNRDKQINAQARHRQVSNFGEIEL